MLFRRIFLFLSLFFATSIVKSQEISPELDSVLEIQYTKKKQYGLDGKLYWPRLWRSLITFKRPDCGLQWDLIYLSRQISLHGLYIDSNKLMLKEEYVNDLKETLSRINESVVFEVIQIAQYPCDSNNIINEELMTRGFLIKPVFRRKFKHHVSGDMVVGILPNTVTKKVEFNTYILKRMRCRLGGCCCIIGWWVDYERLQKEFFKVNPMDPQLIQVIKEDTIQNQILQKKVLENDFYFEQGKSEVSEEKVISFMKSFAELDFYVNKIEITGYYSLEGDSLKNELLAKQRASQIAAIIQDFQKKEVELIYKAGDSKALFDSLVVNSPYKKLARLSLKQIKDSLPSLCENKDFLILLQQMRKAHISMQITYQGTKESVFDKMLEKYKLGLDYNNVKEAERWQKALLAYFAENGSIAADGTKSELKISRFEKAVFTNLSYTPQYLRFMNTEIPWLAQNSLLLSNIGVEMSYELPADSIQLLLKFYEELYLLNDKDDVVKYNYAALLAKDILQSDSISFVQQEKYNVLLLLVQNMKKSKRISSSAINRLKFSVEFLTQVIDSKSGDFNEINVKKFMKKVPSLRDAVFFADYYARLRRKYFAKEILRLGLHKFKNEIYSKEHKEEATEFLIRYISYSDYIADTKEQVLAFKYLSEINPEVFCRLFNLGILTIRYFENDKIKELYCEKCQN